jgi:hypothetical protein
MYNPEKARHITVIIPNQRMIVPAGTLWTLRKKYGPSSTRTAFRIRAMTPYSSVNTIGANMLPVRSGFL